MLAFRNRFHGHGSLRYLYTRGTAVRSRYLTLKYIDHPKQKTPRVAVVVSKKIYKSAVRRNRIRRRIFEVVRLQLDDIKHDTDMVFIITSPDILTVSPIELRTIVGKLLQSAGLYKK